MATYVISPGAWLAGSGLHPIVAANSPLHPIVKGNSPLHPIVAANSPLHPIVVASSPLNPPIYASGSQAAVEAVLAAAQPWRGTDPDWVYEGGPGALLAQALERTRSRIVRPTDPRLPPRTKGVMPTAATAVDAAAPLWRWGSEFRVHAVVADLAWRLRVQNRVLTLTDGSVPSFSMAFAVPTRAFLEEQIDKVLRAAIEREDRLPEILAQSEDILPFFRVVLDQNATATPILAELLAVVWQWATPLVMALKNEVAWLRPVQRSPRVLPVIPTPAHSSLPSGHATMAALTAEILAQLLFDGAQDHPRVQQLDRLARRIAFNRVVAGVHFPFDSAVGYGLGLQLASHFVGWATGTAAIDSSGLDWTKRSELTEAGKRPELKHLAKADMQSASLALMWDAARREGKRGGA